MLQKCHSHVSSSSYEGCSDSRSRPFIRFRLARTRTMSIFGGCLSERIPERAVEWGDAGVAYIQGDAQDGQVCLARIAQAVGDLGEPEVVEECRVVPELEVPIDQRAHAVLGQTHVVREFADA